MKRRKFLGSLPLLAVAGATQANSSDATLARKKPALRIAHITDVHIRPEANVPDRFKKCLQEVLTHKVDLFLNTGDSIHAADYNNITRERVLEQWKSWDECMALVREHEMYTCIGNHDPWWAAPNKEDAMYGIPYVVKRTGMPHRYYSFTKKNWHFLVLDGNNPGVSLDAEQMNWLKAELDKVPADHHVLLMSHYPIVSVTGSFVGGGQHKDYKELKQLFYQHGKKVKVCLSGHQHLLDNCVYNGVHYLCNGAMSGYWWDKGDEKSAGPYYLQETPPGYAILNLYEDGTIDNTYIPHQH